MTNSEIIKQAKEMFEIADRYAGYAGMSKEEYEALDEWAQHSADIVRIATENLRDSYKKGDIVRDAFLYMFENGLDLKNVRYRIGDLKYAIFQVYHKKEAEEYIARVGFLNFEEEEESVTEEV